MGLLDGMQKARIQPDVITFNAAISACGSAGAWQRASELFENIKRDDNLLPDAGTLTCLVMAFTAAGKFAEARTLCDEIADDDDPQYEYLRKRPDLYLDSYPTFKTLQTAFIAAGMEADAWKVQDAIDRFKLEPLQARVTANVYDTQREYENGAQEDLEQPLNALFDLVKDKSPSYKPIFEALPLPFQIKNTSAKPHSLRWHAEKKALADILDEEKNAAKGTLPVELAFHVNFKMCADCQSFLKHASKALRSRTITVLRGKSGRYIFRDGSIVERPGVHDVSGEGKER